MKKFAFISRHEPTEDQIALAANLGIELVHVGDRDGFTVQASEFCNDYQGAVVVHAAAALRLVTHDFHVGVFENESRPTAGGPPTFKAKSLTVFAAEGNGCYHDIMTQHKTGTA